MYNTTEYAICNLIVLQSVISDLWNKQHEVNRFEMIELGAS
jgi:hypothetical protein